MNYPQPGDYIDLHTHGARPVKGVFQVETIMAHEERIPEKTTDLAFTYGIHPWYLDESNHNRLLASVIKTAADPLVIAVGEAGFDKIKGPSMDLQRKTFEEQVIIAEELNKPVVIHCVRAWDELLRVHKRLHPKLPWLVHGFRGNKDLAMQLISKGMYISFWFEFILKPESSELVRSLPKEKIFIETDGAEVDIKEIFKKVSGDLGLGLDGFKKLILKNYKMFFGLKELITSE
jgi:TatD DNase family protein